MRVALVRVFLERSTNHLVARRLPLETPRGGRRSGKEGGIMTVSGQGLRVAFTAALICLVAQARAADTQKLAASCEAAKNQVAGRYTFCRHRAKAKEVKKGSPADFAKCEEKFDEKWTAAEAKSSGSCPTMGDQELVKSKVDQNTASLAALLKKDASPVGTLPETGQTLCDQGDGSLAGCPGSPAGQDGSLQPGAERDGSLRDNNDGTITDTITGLMWEKLSDDDSPHDKDAVYDWYAAFTAKIAMMNGGAGYAGFNDWRMPTVTELQSIVNYGAYNPAAYSAFNNGCMPGCNVLTCSCTQASAYWSSTSLSIAVAAWFVDFTDGTVHADDKGPPGSCVRAVRGGS